MLHALRARTCLFIVIASVAVVARAAESDQPAPLDFNKHVVPILNAYCTACHSDAEPESKLSVENYAALLRGGRGGVAIVPGQSGSSRLLMVLDGRAEPSMPPEGNEKPTEAEVAILKAWIDAGAKGPSGKAPDPTELITPKIKPRSTTPWAIASAAASPDGKTLALGGYGEVRLLDPASRAITRTLSGIQGNVTDLAFSADGMTLVAASGEPGVLGEATVWTVANGSLARRIRGHRDSLYAVALSPDGKLLATGGYDQNIHLWSVVDGKLARTLSGHNGAIFDLAFRPGGKVLASASADRTVKLWNIATGERLDTLSQPLKDVYTLAFSPDGQRLVAGGVDNRLRVWKLSADAKENTNPIENTRFAHEGAVVRLAYSPDGKWLVSSGEDRTVRVWDTVQYVERRLLGKQSDWAGGLAFGADSKSVLIGRLDGSFELVDATTGKPVLPAPPEIVSVSPRGVQRGQSVRVQVSGKNLLGARQITLTGPGGAKLVSPLQIMPGGSATSLAATGTLPADWARGTYMVSVAHSGGASKPVALVVDDLPQRAEQEPNNSAAGAKSTPTSSGYWGAISASGDIDHFQVEARQGETLVCHLEAKSFGSALNGVLTLLDADGRVLARNDSFRNSEDPLLAFAVPRDGAYVVRVADAAMTGAADRYYRLTVGALPYVVGTLPTAATAKKSTQLKLIGYNLPPNAIVRAEYDSLGEKPVALDAAKYRWPAMPMVKVTAEPEILEAEPNNDIALAAALQAPVNVHGQLLGAPGGDADLYRFTAKRGESWIIETDAARRGSPVDTRIEVLDTRGNPVERLWLQAVRDSYITFRSIDSFSAEARVFNWQEMELNQFMYLNGEVCRLFRMPQGPDSGFAFYLASGKRRGYFDTTPTAHALDEPCYIVEAHQPNAELIPNGLPLFRLYYANDDDGLRRLSGDSRLTFTAPTDGEYIVRVTDVRGFSGPDFTYRLSIRSPKPDFAVRMAQQQVTMNAGSGISIRFDAERIDDFDDDIVVTLENLPAGFTAPRETVIQAGHDSASAVLVAAADAKEPSAEEWGKVKILARAKIAGSDRVVSVAVAKQLKLMEKPKLRVWLEPNEVTIAPGTTVEAKLRVERDGYDGAVAFDVSNLPHGVIVADIGLNGILIPEGKTERQVFLKAAPWVPQTDRHFFAESKNFRASNAGNQASPPVLLHVREPGTVAQASAP